MYYIFYIVLGVFFKYAFYKLHLLIHDMLKHFFVIFQHVLIFRIDL